jgi:hypothetical protein
VEIVGNVNKPDVPSATNQLCASVWWKLLEARGIMDKSSNRFFWRRRLILLNALRVVAKANNHRE